VIGGVATRADIKRAEFATPNQGIVALRIIVLGIQ
jgi:hypothetical protein